MYLSPFLRSTKEELLVGEGQNFKEWSDGDVPPHEVWAEIIQGSSAENDTSITLETNDAGGTSVSKTLFKTAIGVKLMWRVPWDVALDGPTYIEAGYKVPDIAIGQMVSPELVIEAVDAQNPTIIWQQMTGKVFENWAADNQQAVFTPFNDLHLHDDSPSLNFAWADASNGLRSIMATVSTGWGSVIVETHVNVLSPQFQEYNGGFHVGGVRSTGTTYGPMNAPIRVGLFATGAGTDLIVWDPIAWRTRRGLYNFVQLVDHQETFLPIDAVARVRDVNTNGMGFLLDTTMPYFPQSYASNTIGWFSDSPGTKFLLPLIQWEQRRDSFKTYLIYQAPGIAQWVPIAVYQWSWSAKVLRKPVPGGFTYIIASQPAAYPQVLTSIPHTLTNDHPVWTANADDYKDKSHVR